MPLEITLKKSEFNIPWGFRLQGGKDFGAPLTIQRIKPGSLVSNSGLQEGDNISMINSESTHGLKHTEAQELIKKGGCLLNLIICRGEEIVVKHNKKDEDTTNFQINLPEVKVDSGNSHSLSASYNTSYESNMTAKPFKVSSNITSNNSSLYKPSLQTITNGLTNLQTNENETDFPPPPPTAIHLASIQPSSEGNTTSVEADINVNLFTPSETLKLVKEIDSGAEVAFSAKTGAGVKASPIQSRLVGILEKKHGLIQHESESDGGYKACSAPKSPLAASSTRNFSNNNFSFPNNNSISLNKASSSQFIGPTHNNYNSPQQPTQAANYLNTNNFNQRSLSPSQRSKSPSQNSSYSHQSTNAFQIPSNSTHNSPSHHSSSSPHQPSNHQSNQSRKMLDSLESGGVPICHVCNTPIRGAYVLAVNKIWCPDHFVCSKATCRKPLSNTGFVEEGGQLYCKDDYELYMAPRCDKCSKPIVGNTVKALSNSYHPECFICTQCLQPIAGGVFHLHEGKVYCDKDFSALFSTKCLGCNFTIEVGDNWIEASGTNWHGECFNCSVCKTNLQDVGFVHRNGKFLCREHARMP